MIDAAPEKGEPLLADQFLVDSYKLPRAITRIAKLRADIERRMLTYRMAMKRANRFLMDDDLTILVTEVAARTMPDTLAQRLHSAVVPYEDTWIEFDLDVKTGTSRRLKTHAEQIFNSPMEGATEKKGRCGLLIQRHGEVAFSITMIEPFTIHKRTKPDARPTDPFDPQDDVMLVSPVPCMYLFDPSGNPMSARGSAAPFTKNSAAVDETMMILRASGWGYYSKGDPLMRMPDQQRIPIIMPEPLRPFSDIAIAPPYGDVQFFWAAHEMREWRTQFVEDLADATLQRTGMLRWTITLLAMLSEVPVRASERIQPSGTRLVNLQNKPYMDYHRVSLKLPRTKPVPYIERKLDKGEVRHRRAHEVRTHWRTYIVDRALPRCGHQWLYDHENGYRLCELCGAYGRLIKEHVRGDASLGWVRKDYVLERNQDARTE